MRAVIAILVLSCFMLVGAPAFALWELKSSGIASDAQNYIACTDVKGEKTTFTTGDEKVVWFGNFTNPNAPLGRFGLPRNFVVEWISPDGNVYSSKRFTSSIGNKTAAHTGMYIKKTKAAEMPGTWKVVIKDWKSKKIVDQKTFELIKK